MVDIDNTTHDQLERSLADVDLNVLTQGRQYYESPAAWEDQVLYFLMLDRFSDGKEWGAFQDNNGNPVNQPSAEKTTPLFQFDTDAYTADREKWFEAGQKYCGGHLAGLQSKIGYLERLGITAIWISPIFKQCVWNMNSYHGYGIQNFLDVDRHFGTRQQLKDLVSAAHAKGIRVILDIILNHAGDVFEYDPDRYWTEDDHGNRFLEARWDGKRYDVKGYRNAFGAANIDLGLIEPAAYPNAWPDDGVWPEELQQAETFTRKGIIKNWNYDPEYREGDFLSLKDVNHGPADLTPDLYQRASSFRPSKALVDLCEVYKFWIAFADIDGYRIDTVKHMEPGAMRFFCNVIHEFAQSLGKENFYLIGEISDGRQNAVNTLKATGLDAALGINDIPDRLEFLAKGFRDPKDYFGLFRNSLQEGLNSHQWFGKHVVTLFDDHDQIGTKHKFRFCGDKINQGHRYLIPALGLNLTTMGIPCIYYGTEQMFDGQDERVGEDDSYSDVFLRECMFGGPFGSLQSTGKHFFNEGHEAYKVIAEICQLRKKHVALRRGRQYLRQLSESGTEGTFYEPEMIGKEIRWVVPWSRIFNNEEFLLAVNADANKALTLWITVDKSIHPPGTEMRCLFSTNTADKDKTTRVEARNGSSLRIEVPAAGFVIWH